MPRASRRAVRWSRGFAAGVGASRCRQMLLAQTDLDEREPVQGATCRRRAAPGGRVHGRSSRVWNKWARASGGHSARTRWGGVPRFAVLLAARTVAHISCDKRSDSCDRMSGSTADDGNGLPPVRFVAARCVNVSGLRARVASLAIPRRGSNCRDSQSATHGNRVSRFPGGASPARVPAESVRHLRFHAGHLRGPVFICAERRARRFRESPPRMRSSTTRGHPRPLSRAMVSNTPGGEMRDLISCFRYARIFSPSG